MRLEDLPLVLLPEEARRVLRRGRTAFYSDIRAGRIRAVRLGGRAIRIPRAELARLLREPGERT